ncbi:MAG: PfkB family carbohydrate kinase [Luteimonas sp.]
MSRVVVVGSFNVDHVWTAAALPRAGETLAGHYAAGPGGKGFNQATAAARAGAVTAFICALGDDAGGALARQLAAGDRIDLRALRSDQATGTAGIYLDHAGRNCIVIGAGANAALAAEHVTAHDDAFINAGVVVAQLESPIDAVIAALHAGRMHGALTLLNPAPANAATSLPLLALTDLLTPNETEFSELIARHVGERIGSDAITLDQPRLHSLCRELLPEGSVVVTLGANGCFVSHADGRLHGDHRAFYRLDAERVQTIDTTGAGDAFNGALAAAIAGAPARPLREHLRVAARFAALSTERHGAAAAMPTKAEVDARFGD